MLFTISWNLLKLMSIESVMLPNHFILCRPHLLLPSVFPSIRNFPKELALRIRWPNHWSFSFSINPKGLVSSLFSQSPLLVFPHLSDLSLEYLGLHPCFSSFLATVDSLDALNSFMTLITISVLIISTLYHQPKSFSINPKLI